MDKKNNVPPRRLYASIAIPFIWLLFLAFWLFYYVTNYSIIQNIAVFLASIVIVAILEVIIRVPWGIKQD